MASTPELVDALVAAAGPVRRLRPPLLRALSWGLVAALLLLALAAVRGARPDLAARLQDPAFALMLFASFATGTLASAAAFALSVPDRSRAWTLLPLPALLLWAGTIGYGCLTDWVRIGPGGISLGATLQCFLTLLLVGLPLTAVLLVMLRHAARLDAARVAAMGGLAVAGVAATALSLLHPLDATVMVLLWHLGLAAVAAALAGGFGRRLLAWAERRAIGGMAA